MQHVPADAEAAMLGLRKALNYVLVLSGNCKSALKAWNLLHPLFETAFLQHSGPVTSRKPNKDSNGIR